MKKAITLSLLLVALILNLKAQPATSPTKNVGIGTLSPHQSAILDLDVSGAEFATKLGFLVPRVTAEQRDAIPTPAEGLMVYVTDVDKGFYYFDGVSWKAHSTKVQFGDKVSSGILYYSADADPIIKSSEEMKYDSDAKAINLKGVTVNLGTNDAATPYEIRFYGGNAGANYVGVKAQETITEDLIFNLPSNNATVEGQVLTNTAEGVKWAEPKVFNPDPAHPNALVFLNGESKPETSENMVYSATDNAVNLSGTSINLKALAGGEAQAIKFFENEANGANSVSVKAPAELEDDVTFELPKNNPAEGNILANTAEGNKWVPAPVGVPIGTILPFAGSQAPEGWIVADGAELSIADYPELFDIIGTTYGGSGNNFNLPNLVGRFPMGLDNEAGSVVGQTGGAASATLEAENIPAHTHTLIARGSLPNQFNDPMQVNGATYATAKAGSGDEEPPLFAKNPTMLNEYSGLYSVLNLANMDVEYPFHSSTIKGPVAPAEGLTPVPTMPPFVKILYIIRAK